LYIVSRINNFCILESKIQVTDLASVEEN
jgi:hypothetical protein